MVCLLVGGVVLSELGLAGLRVRRVLPPAVHAGTPYLMGIALENRKRRLPSFSIEVEDLIDGRPIEKRCYFLKLPAGRVQETAYRHTMARRGRYRLSGFRLATKFPFGLLPRARAIADVDELLRLPGVAPRAGDAAARVAGPPGAGAIVRAQPSGRVPRAARLPGRRRSARHPLAFERAPGHPAGARERRRGDARGHGRARQRAGRGRRPGGVRARGLGGGGRVRRAGAPGLQRRARGARRRGAPRGRRRPDRAHPAHAGRDRARRGTAAAGPRRNGRPHPPGRRAGAGGRVGRAGARDREDARA